ncbi:WDR78 protein, partial [Upupa epops]|nr:WDR78 protein [Upupa epops]
QVFDAEGKDVTPHPLSCSDPRQGGLSAWSACFGAAVSALASSSSTQDSTCLLTTTETPLSETTEPGSQRDTAATLTDVQVRRKKVTEEPTEGGLDRRVDIYLSETQTLWMLDLPSVVVSVQSEDAGRVLERNKLYSDVCKSRAGSDRFVEKMMQTLNRATKNKEVQCDDVLVEEKGTMATSWDLFDSTNPSETQPTSGAAGRSRGMSGQSSRCHPSQEHPQAVAASSDRGKIALVHPAVTLARIQEEEKGRSLVMLTSEKFQQDLFFMERIVMGNIFQPKLAAYRQFPVLAEPDVTSDASGMVAAVKEAEQNELDKEKEDKEKQREGFTDPSAPSDLNNSPEEAVAPSLEQLWTFSCDLTRGHSVSSMAWNKANPDLLAVAYRACDFKDQKDSLVCCWSLKNPKWPERVFCCEHRVTALDFSLGSPSLVGVGLYDGSVAVYDVRSWEGAALLDSSHSSGNHSGPVWQLRWVEQDRDADGRKERLLSISADGRVTEWLVQARLDCTDLMIIKQTEREKLPGEEGRKKEAPLSQQAAGLCFDFHPKETHLYLAGTEEGLVHLCSCLGNRRFLETYRGHRAPVYRVAWNPFSTEMFLSCSADWTILLWHQESQAPLLTFHSPSEFVQDVMWSPKSPFTFAAVNESRAALWDLTASILNPTISCPASPGVPFTSVLFANSTDCLLLGDSEGGVAVFKLHNLAAASSDQV